MSENDGPVVPSFHTTNFHAGVDTKCEHRPHDTFSVVRIDSAHGIVDLFFSHRDLTALRELVQKLQAAEDHLFDVGYDMAEKPQIVGVS